MTGPPEEMVNVTHTGQRTRADTTGLTPDAGALRPRRGRRRTALAGAALLAGGLGVAACSGGTSSTAGSGTSSTGTGQTAAKSGTVQVTNVPGVGAVLVDSSGRTLYMLSADQQKTATCLASTQCTAAWPPLFLATGTSEPVAGPGIQPSLLSTVQDPGGRMQVAYDHWPLYTFAGDSGPGQAHGEGIHSFGGVWSAVSGSGRPATGTPATGSTGGGSYGGY